MRAHQLVRTTRRRKRVGRGFSGGNFSGKGSKGQKSRSGGLKRPGFEGGRTPLSRLLPKQHGFKSHIEKPAEVNLRDLNIFENNDVVDLAALKEKKLVANRSKSVKILGDGQLEKTLICRVNGVTKSAEKAITEKGGKIEKIVPVSKLTNKQKEKVKAKEA